MGAYIGHIPLNRRCVSLPPILFAYGILVRLFGSFVIQQAKGRCKLDHDSRQQMVSIGVSTEGGLAQATPQETEHLNGLPKA